MLNKIYLTTSISTYLCNDNSVSDTFLRLQSVCLGYLPPPPTNIWTHGGEFTSLKRSALQLILN